MSSAENQNTLIKSTARIVAAMIGKKKTTLEELEILVNTVFHTLSQTQGNGATALTSAVNMPTRAPAVPIEESVQEDYIVCLEDGKQLQMLKRHLKTVYKLSVTEYKARWKLPASYPVVAPSYAKRRSAIAREIGLGRTGRKGRIRVKQSTDAITGQEQVAVVKV